ncbi:MAG: hypothetical protein GF353_08790 [Candidatus Lokiarchaeota archaeon]|nr:hypothetical protein [Candidatus Lokiarchaeota archaeon]
MNTSEIPKIKILILGLSNSGKTSIVLSLQKTTNLLSYVSLKPTKRIERSEFEGEFEDKKTKFYIWDFGGQEIYRKEYLNRFKDYLIGTDKIIYVIDIQDSKRYDTALKYLDQILSVLKEEDLNADLSIFFHKFDANFTIEESILNSLLDKIETKIPKHIEFNIFKSSIFTVFQKGLLR